MQDIKYFQELVDKTVRSLGGYWRPLSGLARLVEELGELNEIFIEDKRENEELAGELADLFIISTSIANQYCADLNKEYMELGVPISIQKLYKMKEKHDSYTDGLMRLAMVSGSIGRILNHYEGDKKKKKTEHKQRLAEEIAKLHIEIIKFSNLYEIPLFFYVQQILNHDAERDKDRFDITHDPTTEPSVENFKEFISDAENELQLGHKLWGSYEWDYAKNLEGNLQNSLPSLSRFVKVARSEGLDGYVIEVEGEEYNSNEQVRNETIRRVLMFLNRHDPTNLDENFGIVGIDLTLSFNGELFEWYPFSIDDSLYILLTLGGI